ncbi:MAG: CHAP domain-containing protein, partial [Oscillibacter sp.]|nr:CHAP domain-containing protein [Oscillibacter sp.]
MKRRILSALLAFCMTLTLCPSALAYAVIADPDDDTFDPDSGYTFVLDPDDPLDPADPDSGYTFILDPGDTAVPDPGDTSKPDTGDTSKSAPGDTAVPAPAPRDTSAPVLDDALAALLNDYFGTLLTQGPAVYDCDFEDFLDWMSPDVLENAVIRVEGLSEQEKTLERVTFEVQTYYPETGELYVDVTEKTADGDEFVILHTLRVSGDADNGWYIESDEYGDPLIHDLLSAEFADGAVPRPNDDHPNTWTNTGDQARDIVGIALTQEGYEEVGDNRTKYNVWFYDGKNVSAAWCAIFISWCANQANIPTSIIKKNALASYFSTSSMRRNSFGTATAFAFGSDTPRPGDIAYIDVDNDGVSNHVGLVYDADSSYVYTIEGNTSNKAMRRRYNANTGRLSSSTQIVFFARPRYGTPPESTLGITTAQNSYRIEQGTPCDVRGSIRSNYSLTSARATISTLDSGWSATVS